MSNPPTETYPNEKMMLFCDGSVHPKSGMGFGAYFLVSENAGLPPKNPFIQIVPCKNTSSTRLELETLLWALAEVDEKTPLIIITDSQNIVSLPQRRPKLEDLAFHSKKGLTLHNKDLYMAFFRLLDSRNIEIQKIKGHTKKSMRSPLEAAFSLVDQAARLSLRKYLESRKSHRGGL